MDGDFKVYICEYYNYLDTIWDKGIMDKETG
jgi:hypothetical protein